MVGKANSIAVQLSICVENENDGILNARALNSIGSQPNIEQSGNGGVEAGRKAPKFRVSLHLSLHFTLFSVCSPLAMRDWYGALSFSMKKIS